MTKLFRTHKPRISEKPRQPEPAPAGKPIDRNQLEAAWQDKQLGTEAGPGLQKPPVWPKEIGGPSGPEPTRYGDWERNGICSDF